MQRLNHCCQRLKQNESLTSSLSSTRQLLLHLQKRHGRHVQLLVFFLWCGCPAGQLLQETSEGMLIGVPPRNGPFGQVLLTSNKLRKKSPGSSESLSSASSCTRHSSLHCSADSFSYRASSSSLADQHREVRNKETITDKKVELDKYTVALVILQCNVNNTVASSCFYFVAFGIVLRFTFI